MLEWHASPHLLYKFIFVPVLVAPSDCVDVVNLTLLPRMYKLANGVLKLRHFDEHMRRRSKPYMTD